jgi:Rieske Fe-S protein
MLLTDLILDRENPWATLYDPARITFGDIASADELAPGTGAVLRRGLKKIAIYRNVDGPVTERTAVCPHLGCVVQWNAVEKTWAQRPRVHRSRVIQPALKVLHGPARSQLPTIPRRQAKRGWPLVRPLQLGAKVVAVKGVVA